MVFDYCRSCIENATHYFDVKESKLMFRAVDRLAKGDEIVTCYLGDIYQPARERQALLLKTKYFNCRCKWCQSPDTPDVGERVCAHSSTLNDHVDANIRDFQKMICGVPGAAYVSELKRVAVLFDEYATSPHLPDLHYVKFSALVNYVTCLLYLVASAGEGRENAPTSQERTLWLEQAERAIETVCTWAEMIYPLRSMVVGNLLCDFLEVLSLKYQTAVEVDKDMLLQKGRIVFGTCLLHFEACRGEESPSVRHVRGHASWGIFGGGAPSTETTKANAMILEKTGVFTVWSAVLI
jgi:hypothetical protein